MSRQITITSQPDENVPLRSGAIYYEPPKGKWRDNLCNCFTNLWPSCLCVTLGGPVALCLPIYLAGQISTRLESYSTLTVVGVYLALLFSFWILAIVVQATTFNDGAASFLFYFPFFLAFVFLIVLRYKFVDYFKIQESSIETFCISFWCNPCSLCQMARHLYGYTELLDGDAKIDGKMNYHKFEIV